MAEKITHSTHERPAQTEQETVHIYDTHEKLPTGQHDKFHEKNTEGATQEALQSARELAKETDTEHIKEKDRAASPAEKRRGAPSKKQRMTAFKSVMTDIQGEMSPGTRMMSKFIHSPVVEKPSEFLGATVARPNALLSGSISAFVCITLLYFIAKNYGYQLSGFETIAAFAGGWLIGIIYDYLRALIRRSK